MSIELEAIPLGAVLLIEADFSRYIDYSAQDIETLWQYSDGTEDKYVINYGDEILEESHDDVLDWISDILSLEPHEYICHNDTCILTLKEDLS